ncbi:hypothetical protein DBT_0983 [Dissulfuribacter thermophilus]|uniref:Uncharacterized protein n=1 Tax=Dissulfuribacter thermophilus TaxID=1156395 RepID=A0A1B9F6T8_9BACT|nr:hypothetical protein [Dissulfuribacter thermophilus]OCC15632.1 hypothetical protein DBT_0983 [Dissulfuribacter thermophilus]
MKTAKKKKKPYFSPNMKELGTIKDLTQGCSDGNYTDQAFPIHTPKKDLTFTQ